MSMRLVKPFRVKNVDLSYCGRCVYYLPEGRSRYDFCAYDGMPLEICPEEDFEFSCRGMKRISHILMASYWLSFTKKYRKLC